MPILEIKQMVEEATFQLHRLTHSFKTRTTEQMVVYGNCNKSNSLVGNQSINIKFKAKSGRLKGKFYESLRISLNHQASAFRILQSIPIQSTKCMNKIRFH